MVQPLLLAVWALGLVPELQERLARRGSRSYRKAMRLMEMIEEVVASVERSRDWRLWQCFSARTHFGRGHPGWGVRIFQRGTQSFRAPRHRGVTSRCQYVRLL